jgi:CheY-like chemotaxis protein
MLSQLGHHVETAADGAAALERVRQLGDELGLVVLDLQMPVMDGEETFHRLRSLAPQVPVLLCSGYAREEKAERLLAAGARGYLHKPFELGQLRKAVHRALGAG